MKTKNVTLIVIILLQVSIVTGLTAQQSVHVFPNHRVKKMKELIASTSELAKNRSYFISSFDDRRTLQTWMLNPEEWNNMNENETTDPQLSLEDWMLDPAAMVSNSNEESDSAIALQDWMLDPSKMSVDANEEVQLEEWMLNPTKW